MITRPMGHVKRINPKSPSDMAERNQTSKSDSSAPSGRVHPLVRRCAVCGCSKLFYGSKPKNDSGPADHVMHWNTWERKGLTPPHEVQRGSQPRYVCAGGGKPYVESAPNDKDLAWRALDSE
jgi:hypothetical protein